MRRIEVPVFIVGAGPTGLTATNLLAAYGVQTLTITRYPGTANSPRAHITNQRTMEVFRDLGIEQRVADAATPNALMGNNVWATSFAGTEIARLHTWGSGPERRADYELASPSSMCNIPQHLMEPILLDAARERGAPFLFNTELLSMRQDEAQVYAHCRDRLSGEEFEVVSQYAIGADGDNSVVCRSIGFETEGQMGLGAAINVWLEADLTRYTAHRPGTLYWMTQPGNNYWVGSGTWICVKPFTEWVLLFMYDPAQGEPDLSHEALIARAQSTIGDPDVQVRIKAASKWTINRVVAKQMNIGRVLIAGNAAHRHPPANGLGTNTCVQDTFNLAWKLALVLQGKAGKGLLDTYTQERQPVAAQVVNRAMKSVADMLPISKALGFEPGQDEQAGWANVRELFSNSPRGRERRAVLREAVQLQNYQFNCHGVELGQVYTSPAVVPEPVPRPLPKRDPELYYQPSTYPGACLPHAWLQRGQEQLSTLDLVGRGRFTLLTGVGGDIWREPAARLAEQLGVPIDVISIGGPDCDAQDVYGRWQQISDIGDEGALLVRPDRFIAWREREQGGYGEPAAMLEQVMRQVLDLPATTATATAATAG